MSQDIEALRTAALSMAGHLAAIDLMIRVLIETHPHPQILKTCLTTAKDQSISKILNSSIIPDITVNTMQDIIGDYEAHVNLVVEVEFEVLKAEQEGRLMDEGVLDELQSVVSEKMKQQKSRE